jgi:DNA polymerase
MPDARRVEDASAEHAETAETAYSEPVPRRVSPQEPRQVQQPQPRVEAEPKHHGAPESLGRNSPPASSSSPASASLFVKDTLAASSGNLASSRPLVSAPPAPSPVLSPAERLARLAVLQSEVRDCKKCGLCETRTQTVFARGTGSSGIVFVGEGPGADEDAQGLPFVGKAGQLLDRMIAAMGLERDDVYICNVVKCRPPDNRKPDETEMAACRPYLTEQLELLQPKVIVALGATAVQGLLGLTLGITRLRGQWRLYQGKTPVMPTFHPAYLLRQPSAKREVWQDLQAVLSQLGQKKPPAPSDR